MTLIKKQKMVCNNPKLDLAKMNADIKFGEMLSSCSQDIGRKQILAPIKDHNWGINV